MFSRIRHAAFLALAVLGLSFSLSSCYQAHSDDDLRTVPVTNNPNLVPTMDPMSRLTAIN